MTVRQERPRRHLQTDFNDRRGAIPGTGLEVAERVDGRAVDPDLEVEMGPRAVPGAADVSDHLALAHLLAAGDRDRALVPVGRREVAAVVDHDEVAVARLPAAVDDGAGAAAWIGVPYATPMSIPSCMRPQRQPNGLVTGPFTGQISPADDGVDVGPPALRCACAAGSARRFRRSPPAARRSPPPRPALRPSASRGRRASAASSSRGRPARRRSSSRNVARLRGARRDDRVSPCTVARSFFVFARAA